MGYDELIIEFIEREGRSPTVDDHGNVSPFNVMYGDFWGIDDDRPDRIEGFENMVDLAFEMSEEMPRIVIQMIAGTNEYYFLDGKEISRGVTKELGELKKQHRALCSLIGTLKRVLHNSAVGDLHALPDYLETMKRHRGDVDYPLYVKILDEWITLVDRVLEQVETPEEAAKMLKRDLEDQMEALGVRKTWIM